MSVKSSQVSSHSFLEPVPQQHPVFALRPALSMYILSPEETTRGSRMANVLATHLYIYAQSWSRSSLSLSLPLRSSARRRQRSTPCFSCVHIYTHGCGSVVFVFLDGSFLLLLVGDDNDDSTFYHHDGDVATIDLSTPHLSIFFSTSSDAVPRSANHHHRSSSSSKIKTI